MTTQPTDQNSRSGSGLHLWVSIALTLALLISWLMGYGPGGSKCAQTQSMAASTAATMMTLPPPVVAPASPATITPEPVAAPVAAQASAPEPATASATVPAPVVAPPAATAPVPAVPSTPVVVSPAAGIVSAVPVAKIYFGSEKANLPKGSAGSLAGVVKYLKANAGAKGSVSGFHDASGNLANNEKLALRRAQAVANALEKMGISKDRIVMQKPAQTTGTGKSREARRVEVGVVGS